MILATMKRFFGRTASETPAANDPEPEKREAASQDGRDEANHASVSPPPLTGSGAEERQSEILDFGRVLQEFDIHLSELVQASPKRADSRLILLKVGRALATDADLMRYLIGQKLLPSSELASRTGISRKLIEQGSKLIIAVALLYHGPYPCLRDYLRDGNPTERSVSS
jgi:hypothetical protein